MVDDPRFDFSQETNIKSLLWEKMAQIASANLSRERVSFEGLDGGSAPHTKPPAKNFTAAHASPTRNRGKSK